MATITMDTSEYEAMKKVEKLLEVSIENERKLAEEIKQLNAEKIKALEDAAMRVVKINKVESKQQLLVKLNPKLLASRFEDIRVLLLSNDRKFTSTDGEHYNDNMVANILESCYNKDTVVVTEALSIEQFGLDEVKKEIREDLDKTLSAEVKRKVQIADSSFEVISKLKQENKDLTTNQSKLILQLDKTLKEQKLLEKRFDELSECNFKVGKIINTFLEDFDKGIGYFEAKSYLYKFKEFVIKTLYRDDTTKH